MPRKTKATPKNPLLIASEKARKLLEQRTRDFGAVNLPPEAAALPAHANIEVRRESQKNTETARRTDAFDLLRPGLAPGAFDAVRRLERDMLIRARLNESSGGGERVDCTGGPTTDASLAAAERVDMIATKLPPRDWWLLHDLITTRKPWRDVAGHITGETHEHGQAAAVRAACVNLRDLTAAKMRRAA